MATDAFSHAEAEFALWDMLVRDKNIPEATEVAKRIAQAFPENAEVATFLKTQPSTKPAIVRDPSTRRSKGRSE